MPATRGPARYNRANVKRVTEHLARTYGPHEPEYRGPLPGPTASTASADLTFDQMVAGFVEDPEFRAMVEDEARAAMFAGRGGRRPLPS